jgi:transcriptional regulator with PAS, ATPase and Fis domain
MKKHIEGITPDAMGMLEGYGWPGNVRELKNVMERAAIFAREGTFVGVGEIPDKVRGGPPVSLFSVAGHPPPTLDELARAYVEHVLKQTDGNQAQAARILDISPTTIWRYRNKTPAHAP